jgi:polyribonucleotide nucleotidyltransferase
VNNVRDEVKEGDQVLVKVVNIDPSGKIRLSRKALIEAPEGTTPAPAGAAAGGHGGGEYRGERRRDRDHRGGDRGRRH